MKKEILLWGLTAALLSTGVSINKSNSVEAQASAKIIRSVSYRPIAYHAKSQQSAYVWNRSHTGKVHNLRNFPHTTWYAQKTVVMRFGRQNLTYLKVTSGNGKESGYVWRGYLSKGEYVTNDETNVNGSSNLNDNAKVIATDDFGQKMTTADINDALNQQLVSLFPGTINDAKTQQAADRYYLDFTSGITDLFGEDVALFYPNSIKVRRFVISEENITSSGTNFLTFEKRALGKALPNHSKFSDYAGYHIGAYAFPKGSGYYGQAVVVLIPVTAS